MELLDQMNDEAAGADETSIDDAGAEVYETTDGKPYADDFSNLAEDRIAELKSICGAMDERDEWGQMIAIIRCTLRRYFLIGQQHPYWNADAGQFQVGPSGVSLGDEDENQEEFFEEEFNIYRGFHDVFVSVFSQTAAPTKVEPSNLSGKAVRAAKEAEKYVEVYEHFNPPKCAQSEVGSLMWTDGRIIAETEFQSDEEKCGVDEESMPLGAEFTKFHGVLESKCPIVEPYKDWPYCKVERELDILAAKDQHPSLASKLDAKTKGAVANNEIARMSRIAVAEGIAQVSSDTLSNLVTESKYWLRASAFRHLSKDRQAFWIGGESTSDDGSKQTVTGISPKGLRVTWIGGEFVGAKVFTRQGEPVSALDAQIRVMHSNPGTGNARGSKSDGIVPVQMEFNDAMGMYSEMIHKTIPRTFLNADDSAMAAIVEQFSRWGEYSPFVPQNGLPLSENIFQEAAFDVPASFGTWVQNLQATLPQQLANIQPAMFGGNMDDQKTAKAYAQAKDMSLGVMAIVWVPYLEFKAGVCWQAARLSAERETTKVGVTIPQSNGKSKTVSLDTSVLGRGGFLCKPITDQNFPESHTDVANKWLALWSVVPENPIAAELFMEPDNLASLKDATGLKLVIKGAAARDKQLAEWEMMQQEDGPIPDLEATAKQSEEKQQAAQQAVSAVAPGTQAPPIPPEPVIKESSVPIRLADDHIEEARTCVRILNDSKTLEMLTTQPEMVEDLELHLVAHLTKAQTSGIVIPPDLLGIIPPLPPPLPLPEATPGAGATPGATPGALPGAAGAPPPKAKPAPETKPTPAPTGAPALPLGGPNAALSV